MSHLIDTQFYDDSSKDGAFRRQNMNFQNFNHYLKKLPGFSQSLKCIDTKNQRSEIVLQVQLIKQLPSVIQKIHIDRQRLTLKSTFVLKGASGQIICCPTKCLRIMIIHQLQSLRKKMKAHSYWIAVDQSSGQIVGKHIFSITPNTNICQLLMYQIVPLRQQLSRVLTIILSLTNELPSMYNQFVQEKARIINQVANQDRIQKRIYKYYSYSLVQICKSYSEVPSESLQQPQDKQLIQKLEKQVHTGFVQQSSQIFVHRSKNKYCSLPFKYSFTDYQFTNIKIHLKPPPLPSKRSESNFVFNEIKVLQQYSAPVNSNFSGASTKIILSKLRFIYLNSICSSQNHNKKQLVSKQYTRLMAIKVPLQNIRVEKAKRQSQHEISILKLFSDAQTPFLLRYYVYNNPMFRYNNTLMMTFSSTSQSLSNFLSNKKETISINSKLYILINILQALRLIKDYKVVHMDLHPSNVLVNSNYITNLIDFGESYQQKVCGKQYCPGFTLPFSFPQKFSHFHFTNKSDMFSFGVLVMMSIFKSSPYNASQKLIQSLKNFTYLQKFYFAPQSLLYYGYRKLMVFLFSFIQRCLDPELLVRPHPSWSIILLKQLYYWIEEVSITM